MTNRLRRSIDCIHLGKALERSDAKGQTCNCRGKWLMGCDLYGECTITERREGVANCQNCQSYEADAPTFAGATQVREFIRNSKTGQVVGNVDNSIAISFANGAVCLNGGNVCTCPLPIIVPCCPNPIPQTLTVTFFAAPGSCFCLNGTSLNLVYGSSFTDQWSGYFTVCDPDLQPTQVNFYCQDDVWQLYIVAAVIPGTGCFNNSPALPASVVCDPFAVTFTGMAITGCCLGEAAALVTG